MTRQREGPPDLPLRGDLRMLLVPGAGGSGVGHWHHEWAVGDDRFDWYTRRDLDGGTVDQWVGDLDDQLQDSTKPTVLIAHSLGGIAVAHWANRHDGRVVAALLVAPADVDAAWVNQREVYESFRPVPMDPLPFPAIVVASTDDPYLTVARATAFSEAWGTTLEVVGPHGHLGSDQPLGDWPTGRALLDRLVSGVSR